MPEQEAEGLVTATLLLSYHKERTACWCVSCTPPEGSPIPVLERHGESISEALENLAEAVGDWEDQTEILSDEDPIDADD